MKNPIIAPSILASDWGRFGEEITNVTKAGANWIHVDVMDAHFVPPITFGPGIVEVAKKATSTTIDVHLMIERPENHIEAFRNAGADIITVHLEACKHLHRTIQIIKDSGAKAGVAINPATPVNLMRDIINDVDLVLIMTVNPGWGGQSFIPHSVERIQEAAELIKTATQSIYLEVDGGINASTAKEATNAGANVLVAGTFIFHSDNYAGKIKELKSLKCS